MLFNKEAKLLKLVFFKKIRKDDFSFYVFFFVKIFPWFKNSVAI